MISYNSVEEVDKIFIPLGFHKYNPPDFQSYRYVICMYQKRYDDEIGKKYFIDIKLYDFSKYDAIPENYCPEICGQYYQKGTHNAVNFEFIGWELKDVEEWLDKMFDLGLLEYYEEWDL